MPDRVLNVGDTSSGGRLLLWGAAGGLMAAAASLAAYSRRTGAGQQPPPESQWRKVGRLSQLTVYPLKSGKGVPAAKLLATDVGVREGELRDRMFVAVDRNGSFVSARTHPRLVHVEVAVVTPEEGHGLAFEFRCPNVEGVLTLDLATLRGLPLHKIRVQGTSASSVDCGDVAAAWIRRAAVDKEVHAEASPAADLRLAFFPMNHTDREPHKEVPSGQQGIYSDQTAYHLLTTTSLAALNARMSHPVTASNFRPNFVVDGVSQAFEEDNWVWIRIGDKAIFRVVMPCGRCLLTTVDPETGVKSPDTEPLKTLMTFRRPNADQKKKMGGGSPMMGLRLGIHTCGEISLGDIVYVA